MFRVPASRRAAQVEESGRGAPRFGLRSIANSFNRFKADQRGNVAMMFGGMAIPMFLLMGGAVDIGRWMQARRQTQEAVDAAVLAGLRKYQDSSSQDGAKDKAQAYALEVYKYNVQERNANVGASNITDSLNFELIDNNTSMKTNGDIEMNMSFLPLAGINSMYVLKNNGSELPVSKTAIGKNTGTSLEISVMIDVTGSMCQPVNSSGCKRSTSTTTKLYSVQEAAKSLVDIVVWDDQTQYTSKIALVPFSETVNLGTAALANAARGTLATTKPTNCTTGATKYSPLLSTGPTTCVSAEYSASTLAVTERLGAQAYTDASPSSAPVGRYYDPDGKALPTAAVAAPLSNDKTKLKTAIDALEAAGGTAGHIGTAWAWYMLSPNFNTLWSSSVNFARPYSDTKVKNSKGGFALRKIAILMTDGEYNLQYCNGLNSTYFDGTNEPKCPTGAKNGNSQAQASSLCTNMKAAGIEVYTVGAQVSEASKTFLKSCATSPENYYDATDNNKLKQAFIDIAYKLVPPYLVH
jgi:Flp pilus assembly protein TadG